MPRIAVAGASPLIARAGEIVGGAGGSVADVAVAATLTAICVEPGVCGPAAGGFLTVDLPGHAPVVVDGYMAVPGIGFDGAASTRVVEMAYGGGTTTIVGPGSIAVPGVFAALEEVSRRFGVMPWAETVRVVADLVDEGFPMTRSAYDYMVEGGDEIYRVDPETRRAMFTGKDVIPVGETMYFDDLGDTLRLIGDEGAEVFYQGDLGRRIVEDLGERGSMLTREDLVEYQVIMRQPLSVEISSWNLLTNPPPAVGGAAVVLALGAIARAPDPMDANTWLAALRLAFETRVNEMEHADDRDDVISRLLRDAGLRSPSTISVSAIDDQGGAVAATFSAGYGSGVIPSGTGLLMNNGMGEVELNPGGSEVQVPGERLMSNMAPSVMRAGTRAVAVASPGADRITTALTITLARIAMAGDDIASAIEHPRVHPRPSGAATEPGIEIDLPSESIRAYPAPNMYFGGVVGTTWADGVIDAHADSRRGGAIAFID
jgi:gamma-glutamyltranspeptidase/glutathione hydrolase